jgi:hypothetical protein
MKSQNEAILKDLQRGKKITSLQAWTKYGCSALNSRISNIRNQMGIPVNDEWVKVKGFKGQEKRVKRYFIPQ